MGRRFPDGGLLRYRKWVPQQLGDVADRQPTNGSAAQQHGSQSHRFAVRVWSNLCICSPGLVELVKSNLAPDFPLFHACTSTNLWSPRFASIPPNLLPWYRCSMPAGRAAPGVANSSSCSRLQHQFNKYVKCGGGEGGGWWRYSEGGQKSRWGEYLDCNMCIMGPSWSPLPPCHPTTSLAGSNKL